MRPKLQLVGNLGDTTAGGHVGCHYLSSAFVLCSQQHRRFAITTVRLVKMRRQHHPLGAVSHARSSALHNSTKSLLSYDVAYCSLHYLVQGVCVTSMFARFHTVAPYACPSPRCGWLSFLPCPLRHGGFAPSCRGSGQSRHEHFKLAPTGGLLTGLARVPTVTLVHGSFQVPLRLV